MISATPSTILLAFCAGFLLCHLLNKWDEWTEDRRERRQIESITLAIKGCDRGDGALEEYHDMRRPKRVRLSATGEVIAMEDLREGDMVEIDAGDVGRN